MHENGRVEPQFIIEVIHPITTVKRSSLPFFVFPPPYMDVFNRLYFPSLYQNICCHLVVELPWYCRSAFQQWASSQHVANNLQLIPTSTSVTRILNTINVMFLEHAPIDVLPMLYWNALLNMSHDHCFINELNLSWLAFVGHSLLRPESGRDPEVSFSYPSCLMSSEFTLSTDCIYPRIPLVFTNCDFLIKFIIEPTVRPSAYKVCSYFLLHIVYIYINIYQFHFVLFMINWAIFDHLHT